jgi:hypothetical protein
MPSQVEPLKRDLVTRAREYGIRVEQADLDDEVPGVFDGPTITLNREYDAVERAFYLAHSIGSIAEWSLRFDPSKRVFDALKHAKQVRNSDEARFQSALEAYLAFENRTWETATWLLQDTQHAEFVARFTTFGRADLESMRIFHSTGKAPVWREFFAQWNDEVQRGTRTIEPFVARPIPKFKAVRIPKQEIVQEED